MENQNEIWKDILGYEGVYQISSKGRVKSLGWNRVRSRGRISHRADILLKQTITHRGYKRVELNLKGSAKKFVIHRLVAIAFISNPSNKPEVNHIDGNKENNDISNLEWCTSKENKSHAFVNGLSHQVYGEKHVQAKLSLNDVIEIKRKFASGDFKNQTKVSKIYNVSRATIRSIVNNVNWKSALDIS
jgi:hypothetical protein